jgi:hypothetical protein
MLDFSKIIYEFQYNLIVMVSGIHWSLQKAILMAGYTVKVLNIWLIDQAFAPIIAGVNSSLGIAVSYVFIVALLVLGLTYLLAAFIRLEVVNPRSALMWYVAGALFFAIGPNFYQGMNAFRLNIAQVMYLSVLEGLQANAGDFSSLAQVNSHDLDLGSLCDHLDVYLPGATGVGPIDGLDIALSYLRAHAEDVMGYPQPIFVPSCPPYLLNSNPATWAGTAGSSVVPMDWNSNSGYFDHSRSPITWNDSDAAEWSSVVALAGSSQQRALTAWPLLLFGLVEQVVHLLITIAMGITFISFGIAILFAFFKRTESIAQHLINQWLELIVQTTIIALVQALVVGFFLAGAATGSAAAVVGIGLICLVFILITLWSGIKAVWNSFNRLFNAMGQVSGNVLLAPGSVASAATLGTAAAMTGGLGLATGMGSNALAGMTALNNGATSAQTLGLMLGGSPMLTGAARTLAHLPGLRGTTLGEAAEQFTEGAITRQVGRHIPMVGQVAGPLIGAALLSDRHPDHAEYDDHGRLLARPMLVPAVGSALENWTVPKGASRMPRPAAAMEWFEDENGEMTSTFAPLRPRRMGMFTPVATMPESDASTENHHQQERNHHAAAMQGEEMEQHLSDTLHSSTGTHSPLGAIITQDGKGDMQRLDAAASRLEQSAEALASAARVPLSGMLGQLQVSGSQDIASVMGDVLRGMQQERQAQGQPLTAGTDYLTVGDHMARSLGIAPPSDGTPAVQDNLARFGLFTDQALRTGISGEQAEQVIMEVKSSPDGKVSDATRTTLVEHSQRERGVGHATAQADVDKLEHSARLLPETITAFGWLPAPTQPPTSPPH